MDIILNIDKDDDDFKPKFKLFTETENGVEQVWGTKNGEQIPFSQVTHQHWSNIFWYHRYISESAQGSTFLLDDFVKKAVYLMNVALKKINERFDGEILDWIPKYDNEKRWYKNQNTRKVLIEKYTKDKPRVVFAATQRNVYRFSYHRFVLNDVENIE